MHLPRIALPALTALLAAALMACGDDKKTEAPPNSSAPATIAPTASSLAPAKPATMEAKSFSVDRASSKVDFLMEAPKEKIHGLVPGAATGDLHVDFTDITKTTGLVTVDIGDLVLKQAKVDDAGKISEETKVDKQNEHARTWLEISPDAPADVRKANSVAQFSIRSIETTGPKDVSKMAGKERLVTFQAKGEFLLHGHKAEKTAELQATFVFDGDKPVSVSVKSVKPFAIGLAEFDVKPRDAFGKFALKSLDALAPKVAKEAQVTIEFTAKIGG